MQTKFLVTAILLSSCLTSWAWFPKSITQEKINQLRVGQTTEADPVQLFGPPTLRTSDLSHSVPPDWLRSVPVLPPGSPPVLTQSPGRPPRVPPRDFVAGLVYARRRASTIANRDQSAPRR